jgi:hypothetical protein
LKVFSLISLTSPSLSGFLLALGGNGIKTFSMNDPEISSPELPKEPNVGSSSSLEC